MNKKVAKVWYFPSSSGSKCHETLQYTDGSTSCGCMGWCRRVAYDGSRTCKHTRLVESGMAGVPAKAFVEVETVEVKPAEHIQTTVVVRSSDVVRNSQPDTLTSVVRKIQWD